MTPRDNRSSDKRPRRPHVDTELKPTAFPHAKDTVHSLFRGWSTASPECSDGHAEPLRLWREYGLDCPDGWYAVRCRIAGQRKQALALLVEMNPSAPLNPALSYAPFTYRTLWWTPSPEHAGEVARQFTQSERRVYASYDGHIHPLSVRALDTEGYRHDKSGVSINLHWVTLPVDIQVYQRCGDVPRLVSVTRAQFYDRPRAV